LRRVRSRASRGRFAGRDAVSSPLLRLVGAAASFTQRRPASGDSAAVHKALRARWSPSFRRSSQLVSSLFDRWASNFGRARPSGCDHAGRPLAYLAFASCRRAIARKAEFKSEEAQTTPADGLGLWAAQRDVPKGRSPGRPFVLRPRSARAVNQLIGCSDRHRRASEGRPQGRPFVAERELRPATPADPRTLPPFRAPAALYAAAAALLRDARQPAKPKPAKPTSIIAQVDGSGVPSAEGIGCIDKIEDDRAASSKKNFLRRRAAGRRVQLGFIGIPPYLPPL
jgi:hypothetical protein